MVEDAPISKAEEGVVSNTPLPTPSSNTPNYIETTPNLLDKADAVAARMEAANKKSEELLIKHEAVVARLMISGRAQAGVVAEPKEETPAEYKERVLRGG